MEIQKTKKKKNYTCKINKKDMNKNKKQIIKIK